MNVSRRDCLRGGAATAGAIASAALLAGCSQAVRRYTARQTPRTVTPLPPASHENTIAPAARLLNRLAFGPAPGDVARIAAMGSEAFVDEQLHPNDADEPPILTLRLRGMVGEAQDSGAWDLQDLPERDVLRQMAQAALLRAVYSHWQLRERLVDLWTNHFNIYARKNLSAYYTPADQANVIRAHALGKFPDLVRASARSPAMLGYLDNEANRKGVPNENYARELLELHTLGVNGGYTQRDVREVARCLTGWTIEDRFLRRRGTFRFAAERHDNGEKIVLGHRISANGGERDGERVLDIVCTHPSTARFIAGKIVRYFLGEGDQSITNAWTSRLAAIYTETSGDIRAMLRPLLLSDDLVAGPPILKRPFDFVVSSLRALHADTDGGTALQTHLAAMGQPLHEWPLPDGYPDTTHAWTGSLLARWNFAFALTTNQIAGTRLDLPGLVRAAGGANPNDARARADALVALTLARRADESEHARFLRDKVTAYLMATLSSNSGRLAEAGALCLAAPQFQWR